LRKHWQKETGFAFPSGHTMFAASWALLGVGLLWPRRRWVTLALLLTWATAVMGSRLALGMHWPQDLIVATLISWLLVTLATWLAQRFCGPLSPPGEEAQDIKKGGSAGIMLILPLSGRISCTGVMHFHFTAAAKMVLYRAERGIFSRNPQNGKSCEIFSYFLTGVSHLRHFSDAGRAE
jgi:hypothetical protein